MSRAYSDYLADILRHAMDAIACVEERTLEEMAADRLRCLALERCFEVMGEAAGKVPASVRERFPAVPWSEMVAVRNRVAHAYFAVDASILYRTAQTILPTLLAPLREAYEAVLRDEAADDAAKGASPRVER